MTKKIVLIVDDNIDNIDLLSNILTSSYKLRVATNGEIAMETPMCQDRTSTGYYSSGYNYVRYD